ncbi:polysaccharide deacetylase family protein [Paenibacillus sp. IHBB 10380]|uniref:polysaccharide deacetylase family protein n=1 Tax=Paenibacillus sp. IHBB 10380 TaxID=1566358 RepID=UPI0005CF99C1|nr:polysaccharide deacetylase family protein [Paenibacillus sp. IHBB 10380]AJS58009.1 xylanase deacetylase [Paenibacillus sp. IHBB 10380]
MTKHTAALFLAISLVLSACNNQDAQSSQPEPIVAPTGEVQQPEPIPSSTMEEDKEPSPEVNEKAEDQEAAPEAEVEVPLKYHMNSNYDIVPNDESSPKKVVLLTFDDGPKEETMINDLIDTLEKHSAKAIFFVNGYRVKENPDLLKLIHEREQIIGNHSWDHIELRKESETKVKKQIEDVQKIVKDTVGETPVFFRPPHGAGGDVGKKVAKENGLLYMTWSNGSLDWEMKSKDKNKTDQIMNNVMDQLHSGSNILMHELPWTVESLDALLTKLEAKGYSFVDPRSIELKMR